MRLLAAKIILAALPIVAMMCVNYFIDPANLFRHGVEERMAARLLLGQAVPYVLNYDERLVQQSYVQKVRKSADVIVFGSSRVMQVRSAMFPGRSMFNHAVSGATIEDFIAIAGAYDRRGLLPRQVVFECDPWLFNAHNGQQRWRSIADDVDYMSRRLGLAVGWAPLVSRRTAGKYFQAVSPAYFQEALRHIGATRSEQLSERGDTQLLLADGSILYPTAFRQRTPGEASADARRALAGPIYSLNEFDALDPQAIRALDALVDYYQQAKVKVSIVLIPYHPIVFSALQSQEQYQLVSASEGYFRELAASRHLPLAGSYDPVLSGCDETDFFDGMHPNDRCAGRIIARLDALGRP
jgi:hypothetical protein